MEKARKHDKFDLTARKSVTEGSRRQSAQGVQPQVGLKPDSENTGGGQTQKPYQDPIRIYLRYPKISWGLPTLYKYGKYVRLQPTQARCPRPTPG